MCSVDSYYTPTPIKGKGKRVVFILLHKQSSFHFQLSHTHGMGVLVSWHAHVLSVTLFLYFPLWQGTTRKILIKAAYLEGVSRSWTEIVQECKHDDPARIRTCKPFDGLQVNTLLIKMYRRKTPEHV